MLARAGLGDDFGLAHADSEQDLADAIVDLVRAGVIKLVALEPYLRAIKFFRQARREIERARAADIVLEQVLELSLERGIRLCGVVVLLKVEDQRHQRFGDIASAELAEMPALIGLVAE